MSSLPKISVIVPSGQLTPKVLTILRALHRNHFPYYEVIIIPQGVTNRDLITKIRKIANTRIFVQRKADLCEAYNLGARKARAEILAFLSDDCYPQSSWLSEIYSSLSSPEISCVTGNTYPFLPTEQPGSICFCTFTLPLTTRISSPKYHAREVGYSNNFAIKKTDFFAVGGFRKIFSPGAIGIHAPEADLFLRIVIHKGTIAHNPRIIVWHDHWIPKNLAREKNLLYLGGETACYGLYALKGYRIGMQVLLDNFFFQPQKRIKKLLQLLMQGKTRLFRLEAQLFTREMRVRIIGLHKSLLLWRSHY